MEQILVESLTFQVFLAIIKKRKCELIIFKNKKYKMGEGNEKKFQFQSRLELL